MRINNQPSDYVSDLPADNGQHERPMGASVITFRQRPRNTEHYFGACPECDGTHGYLNVGARHWFVCDTHQTKWPAGCNLFSGWREESEAHWRQNAERLRHYRLVDPLPMEAAGDGDA